ncbi:MAG: DUF2177 family protein [Ramlibacter sp.]|nr:DUF2177 family protein [Ramlibacter sp.]
MPRRWPLIYLAVASTLFLADMVWLLGIASAWYQQGLGHLMASQPRMAPALGFYLIYPVGLVIFAVRPGQGRHTQTAAVRGALFGFFAYSTYDLTNLAILRDWPVGLSLLDVAWGTAAGALSAAAGGWVADRKKKEG